MNLTPYVLQEIAGQDDHGGAHPGTIRTLVDGRQKLLLTGDELQNALAELEARGQVIRQGEKHRLSESLRRRVPRTANSQVSMGWSVWEQFTRELASESAAS